MVEYLVGDLLNRVGLLADLPSDSRARLSDLLRPCRFPPANEIFGALDVGACDAAPTSSGVPSLQCARTAAEMALLQRASLASAE